MSDASQSGRTDLSSPLLEIPEVRARFFPLSVHAYTTLAELSLVDQRAELICGVIVKQMPKSPLHCQLIKRIFLSPLAFQRGGLLVFTERPLRLKDSMPEPDVMITHGEESDFDTRHPTTAELIVEVAVSSATLDRENTILYAEAGVEEYWIVLAVEKKVEVYQQLENGTYLQKRIYSADETLDCTSVPGLRVPLRQWFG